MRGISRFATFLLVLAIISGVSFAYSPNTKASVAGFEAGRIMDDAVMANKNTMSEAQIQTFLKSKNSCNDSDYAKYQRYTNAGYIYSWRDGHFVCMADENFDGESAAHIIWQAAQDYNINPQVIIVLLQKEQGLVTDTWPNKNHQYAAATGYDCPDNGNGCNNANAGFKTQIRKAANLFRTVLDGGWSNYPVGVNYIQYHPNPSCNGTNVTIQNRATSALYRYTPYQPNRAALNAGYGTGDSCSSYGNRNFYNYFTDWFGGATGPAYSWSVSSQIVYTDSNYSTRISGSDNSIGISPGQTVYVKLVALNNGGATWDQNIRLATSSPKDRNSVFQNSSWMWNNRVTYLKNQTVAPGGTGTFQFSLTAPQTPGLYNEHFLLIDDSKSWFNDIGMYIPIRVTPSQQPMGNEASSKLTASNNTLAANQTLLSTDGSNSLVMQSDGNLVLFHNFKKIWSSNTAGSGAVTLRNQPDGNLVLYKSNGQAVWGSGTVQYGNSLTNVNAVLGNGLTLRQGQMLQSYDRKHKLILQSDGNLVIYGPHGATWGSGTDGKPAAYVTMQSDGNLVIYNSSNKPLWGSGTEGR